MYKQKIIGNTKPHWPNTAFTERDFMATVPEIEDQVDKK